jgi:hypothetical protein
MSETDSVLSNEELAIKVLRQCIGQYVSRFDVAEQAKLVSPATWDAFRHQFNHDDASVADKFMHYVSKPFYNVNARNTMNYQLQQKGVFVSKVKQQCIVMSIDNDCSHHVVFCSIIFRTIFDLFLQLTKTTNLLI